MPARPLARCAWVVSLAKLNFEANSEKFWGTSLRRRTLSYSVVSSVLALISVVQDNRINYKVIYIRYYYVVANFLIFYLIIKLTTC